MDQAAAGFSAILTGLVDNIREELNELKQSNTTLIKKIDALEAQQTDAEMEIETLKDKVEELQAELEAQKALKTQFVTSLKEVQEKCSKVDGRFAMVGGDMA